MSLTSPSPHRGEGKGKGIAEMGLRIVKEEVLSDLLLWSFGSMPLPE